MTDLHAELFWVDLALTNPLSAEVNLGNVTLVVEKQGKDDDADFALDVEIVKEVILGPRETRVVSSLIPRWNPLLTLHPDPGFPQMQSAVISRRVGGEVRLPIVAFRHRTVNVSRETATCDTSPTHHPHVRTRCQAQS
mgnify:CR=1 FL=1